MRGFLYGPVNEEQGRDLFVVGDHPFCELASDGPAGHLIEGRGPGLEIWPEILWHLHRQVPRAVSQATLALRSGKTGIDRLDDRPATV